MCPRNENEFLEYDVAIVGGGMVGLSLAVALQDQDISVALIDLQEPTPVKNWKGVDPRVSALTKSSENFFRSCGVWKSIEDQGVSPFVSMEVWEQDGSASLQFFSSDIGHENLGHIVENRVIVNALFEKLFSEKNMSSESKIDWLCPEKVDGINREIEKWQIKLASGKQVRADLLIGADGANSLVRKTLAFDMDVHDLGHHAIVTRVKTELPHEKIARQRFLQGGPLAFLPLLTAKEYTPQDAKTCSIVWSLEPDKAKAMMALDESSFHGELTKAFEGRLGEVLESDDRFSFPLSQRHAKNYCKTGAALIGDAAHTIHPLAGQGVNLGFMDAAVLAEEIIRAKERGISIASREVLRRYERRRKSHNTFMMQLMRGFQAIFSQNNADFRWLRNVGMRFTNNTTLLKQHIISRAMGLEGDLPKTALRHY